MSEIAEKIIELRIATRRATMCESLDSAKRNTLSLKSKILYLLKKDSLTPADIIDALQIAKANLTLLANEMIDEGLMTKDKQQKDKREILYNITPQGAAYLDNRIKVIEENFCSAFKDAKEYKEALKNIDNALNTLSFL